MQNARILEFQEEIQQISLWISDLLTRIEADSEMPDTQKNLLIGELSSVVCYAVITFYLVVIIVLGKPCFFINIILISSPHTTMRHYRS